MYFNTKGINVPEESFVYFMESYRNDLNTTVFNEHKKVYKNKQNQRMVSNYLKRKNILNPTVLYKQYSSKNQDYKIVFPIFKTLFNRFVNKERIAISLFKRNINYFPNYITSRNIERYRDEYKISKIIEHKHIDNSKAIKFEKACVSYIKNVTENFKTEEVLRKEQKSVTPDILFDQEININDTPIRWIDVKSYYGSHYYRDIFPNINKTIEKYYAVYKQKGAIIFQNGFSKKLLKYIDRSKVILINGHKNDYLKELMKLQNT